MTADRPDGDDRVWMLSTQEFLQMVFDDWTELPDEDGDEDADAHRQEQDTRSEYRVDGEDLQ